jgi:hypothetical protein
MSLPGTQATMPHTPGRIIIIIIIIITILY